MENPFYFGVFIESLPLDVLSLSKPKQKIPSQKDVYSKKRDAKPLLQAHAETALRTYKSAVFVLTIKGFGICHWQMLRGNWILQLPRRTLCV